uniref:Uncharacterized protein n=1 Tax=Rhizophora mucronata TaxID=61149 RepID=A0A2P2M492_RHIMU
MCMLTVSGAQNGQCARLTIVYVQVIFLFLFFWVESMIVMLVLANGLLIFSLCKGAKCVCKVLLLRQSYNCKRLCRVGG